jgi:tetratricopeptide (TPR) repeat protein
MGMIFSWLEDIGIKHLDEGRAAFERAVNFMQSGDPEMAMKICQGALEQTPDEPNFLTLLGASLARQLRWSDAEDALKRALKSAPDYPKAHEELGNVFLRNGKPEAAIDCLERALELDPSLDSARMRLSQALNRAGDPDQAYSIMESFLEKNPHHKLMVEAAELQHKGHTEAAEKIYRDILRQDSRNVDALRMLALLAIRLEHYKDAETLLRRAVGIAPDFRMAWLDLGRALAERSEFEEGIRCIQRGIELDPTQAMAFVTLGNTLARASRQEDAIEAYQAAARLRPGHAGIFLGLGNVLKTIGEQEQAVEIYRHGIELNPDFGEMYWSLSNLKTFQFNDIEVAAMEEQLGKENLSADSQVHFHFALGKALEDREEYARAFGHFDAGNHVRREQESYDPVETEFINDRIIKVFDAEFLDLHKNKGLPDPAPIFVVGLPRSGSTLVEQILSSHSQVDATHELPEVGRVIKHLNAHNEAGKNFPEAVATLANSGFRELGQLYMQYAGKFRKDGAYFIDKMPNNFPSIGFLSLILPQAKFIDTRRHPMDNLWSAYKQLFAKGQSFTYDLFELADYYKQYLRMMKHWDELLPNRVMHVHYEHMVSDQETQTRRLLEYCGLDFEEACLRYYENKRAIRTASSEQVRRPIYTSSIGVWKHYKDQLSILQDLLGDEIADYEREVGQGA